MHRRSSTTLALLALLAPSTQAQSATPLANPAPLVGERFGVAIDVDGATMVVSASGDGGSIPANTYVYELLGGAWARTASLPALPASTTPFGSGLVLDSAHSRIARGVLSLSTGLGEALIYERSGSSWPQVGAFAPAGLFGSIGPIALRGDSIVVGNPSFERVHVGRRQNGAWNEVQVLQPTFNVGSGGSSFGGSVTLDGDMLLVSAPQAFAFSDFNTGLETRIGRLYVFTRANATANWGVATTLTPPLPPWEPALLRSYGAAHAVNANWVATAGFNSFVGWGVDLRTRNGASVSAASTRLPAYTSSLTALAFSGDRLVVASATELQFWRYDTSGSATWVLDEQLSAPSASSFSSALDVGSDAIFVGDPQYASGTGVVWEFGPPAGLRTYCTAKLNSDGCLPAIGWVGAPSVNGASAFTVNCSNVVPQRAGVLIYAFQHAATPFLGATLCVASLQRTSVVNSGGAASCSGVLSFDFGAHIQSGVDPALTAGTKVYAQWWHRDAQTTPPHGLSNAVHMIIQP